MAVQMKMQAGQLQEESEQKEAQELFMSLQDNVVMAELLTKEQALQTITGDLQDIIFKPLQELYGQ